MSQPQQQNGKPKSWEFKKDDFGILVFINGVRASFKPGSGKSGYYGAVVDAEIDNEVNRTVKVSLCSFISRIYFSSKLHFFGGIRPPGIRPTDNFN